MAVFRVHKTDNYTVMSNKHLRDPALSLKAKGLLSMVFSLPDDWKYSINGLAAICKEGPDAVKTAIRELETNGYVVRTKVFPDKSESGRIEYRYDFYEEPMGDGKQPPKKQPLEFQPLEVQGLEVQPLLNKEELSKEEPIKDNQEELLSSSADSELSEKVREIVSYLNEVCGTNYRPTTAKTRALISARLNEGFTVDDFRRVIDDRHAKWSRDTRMREYLRPETLFGTKFESYLNSPSTASRPDYSMYN